MKWHSSGISGIGRGHTIEKGPFANNRDPHLLSLGNMEAIRESCVVRSQWICKVSLLVWGEIYAILGRDSNKVQKRLLVNKIHLQSGEIQGILLFK